MINDSEVNAYAANFIKKKIAQIVKDPEKARKLMPREIYARRPICDGGYYSRFNQDNCDIVNLFETPIAQIEEKGIRCTDGKLYELDVLICATGFDVEGNYDQIHFQGRNGLTLKDKWDQMPAAHLGVFPHGMPNMFNLLGPSMFVCHFVKDCSCLIQLDSFLMRRARLQQKSTLLSSC